MGYFSKKKIGIIPDSAKSADMIRRNLTRLDNFSVASPLVLQEGNGSISLGMDDDVTPFWALISGSSSPYSWKEAKANTDGTWNNCCRTGTSTAYEVNQVTGINNTYQYLIPDDVGGYRFEAIQKGTPSCLTTIVVNFLDLAGKTNFPCGGPADVFWTITGTSNSGTTISLSGQTTVASPTYNMVLSFDGTVLPAGSYSIHVFTKSAICGQSYGVDGRFDGTWSFTVTCPKTSVTNNLQSKFDVTTIVSNFGVGGCGTYWYLDGLPQNLGMSVSASNTGSLTPCNTQVLPFYNNGFMAGNIAVTYKLTDYNPFTVTFTANAPNCITSTETRSYSKCGSYTSDWPGNPYIFYGMVPLQVGSGCNPYAGQYHGYSIEGATVTCTGQLSVTGTTAIDGYVPSSGSQVPRWKATMASNYIYPKVGVTADQLVSTWTVSYDQYFQPATYNTTDLTTAQSKQQFYAGSFCNLGGDLNGPISSKACVGCPLPVNTTLHASVSGNSVTLTYDGYGWGGFGTLPMNALTCVSPPQTPKPSSGNVSIYLYLSFVGSNSGNEYTTPSPTRPYLSLFYASSGGNGPTLCARNYTPQSQNNAGWDIFEIDQSYGGVYYDAVCPPSFYAEEKYYGDYGVNRMDGSGQADYYDIEINIIITE